MQERPDLQIVVVPDLNRPDLVDRAATCAEEQAAYGPLSHRDRPEDPADVGDPTGRPGRLPVTRGDHTLIRAPVPAHRRMNAVTAPVDLSGKVSLVTGATGGMG